MIAHAEEAAAAKGPGLAIWPGRLDFNSASKPDQACDVTVKVTISRLHRPDPQRYTSSMYQQQSGSAVSTGCNAVAPRLQDPVLCSAQGHTIPLTHPQHTRHVQNVGLSMRTLQFKRPAEQCFAILNPPLGVRLAPGMSTSFRVAFRQPVDTARQDVSDSVLIKTEGGATSIPLSYSAPHPSIQLTGSCDFGSLPIGSAASLSLAAENAGDAVGSWSLHAEGDLPVSITPSSGELQPGCSEAVSIAIKDIEVGASHTELVLSGSDGKASARHKVTVAGIKTSLDIEDATGAVAAEVFGYHLLLHNCHSVMEHCQLVHSHT